MSVTDEGFGEIEDTPPKRDDPDIVQARNHAKKLEDQLKARDKKLSEVEQRLADYESRERQNQIETVFSEAQLPPGLAKVFPADREITVENVQAFAAEIGVASSPEQTNEKSQAQAQTATTGGPGLPQPAGAAPAVQWHNPSVTGMSTVSPNSMTFKEFDKLARENPLAARQASAEGRVDWGDVVEHSPGVWGWRTKGT